jgi:hypothetical protein
VITAIAHQNAERLRNREVEPQPAPTGITERFVRTSERSAAPPIAPVRSLVPATPSPHLSTPAPIVSMPAALEIGAIHVEVFSVERPPPPKSERAVPRRPPASAPRSPAGPRLRSKLFFGLRQL